MDPKTASFSQKFDKFRSLSTKRFFGRNHENFLKNEKLSPIESKNKNYMCLKNFMKEKYLISSRKTL